MDYHPTNFSDIGALMIELLTKFDISSKTPTVVRRDVPAWQHGQPQGADVVNGMSHVTMRVSMNDLAPTMLTLNPYAPVFTPRGFYGLS